MGCVGDVVVDLVVVVVGCVGDVVVDLVVVVVGSPPPDEEQVSPSSRSQQPDVPHGATRSLPELATHTATSQRASGIGPVISLKERSLRRRGAVARRAGRRRTRGELAGASAP